VAEDLPAPRRDEALGAAAVDTARPQGGGDDGATLSGDDEDFGRSQPSMMTHYLRCYTVDPGRNWEESCRLHTTESTDLYDVVS
jgi:hypothetical protein